MFSLFGFGRGSKTDFGPTVPMRCPKCRNESYWRFLELKRWFTVFFVPVFPYESKHVLICNVCSSGVELKGSQIESAKALNRATVAYLNGETNASEYSVALSGIRLLGERSEGVSAPAAAAS